MSTFRKSLRDFYKKAKVRFKKGTVVTPDNKNINSLEEALGYLAECSVCGCDPCLGYTTQMDVDTGEVMAIFIEAGAVVVMPLTTAKPYLRAKKDARNA